MFADQQIAPALGGGAFIGLRELDQHQRRLPWTSTVAVNLVARHPARPTSSPSSAARARSRYCARRSSAATRSIGACNVSIAASTAAMPSSRSPASVPPAVTRDINTSSGCQPLRSFGRPSACPRPWRSCDQEIPAVAGHPGTTVSQERRQQRHLRAGVAGSGSQARRRHGSRLLPAQLPAPAPPASHLRAAGTAAIRCLPGWAAAHRRLPAFCPCAPPAGHWRPPAG